jgi:Ran GTPase-activating protein (RanGAP) involved in mRNA processing and transport
MGAMTSLHVGLNRIPSEDMKEIIRIAIGMESMKMLCEVPIKDKTLTSLDVSGKDLGHEGALVVAEYLRDNWALTSVDISSNGIVSGEWMDPPHQDLKVGDLVDGKQISTVDEDDGQIYVEDLSGIRALADAIPDMRALTKLDISNNSLEQGEALQQIIEYCNTKGIELDNHERESGGGY